MGTDQKRNGTKRPAPGQRGAWHGHKVGQSVHSSRYEGDAVPRVTLPTLSWMSRPIIPLSETETRALKGGKNGMQQLVAVVPMVAVPTDAGILARAELAVGRLRKSQSFEDWLLVGEAVEVGHRICQERAGSPRAFGWIFNGHMSERLDAHPWLKSINRVTRCAALWLHKHCIAVTAWRNALPESIRLTLNDPAAIQRKYISMHRQDGQQRTRKAKAPSRRIGQAKYERFRDAITAAMERSSDPDFIACEGLRALEVAPPRGERGEPQIGAHLIPTPGQIELAIYGNDVIDLTSFGLRSI
jgi:hypothetical protein